MAQMGNQTPPGQIRALGQALGVTAASLARLGAAWSMGYRAWAFPMFDPAGEIVGVRLRSETGAKWAIEGSHNALFVPDGGLVAELAEEIAVCEGPTSCAALLDLGWYAIGRPSCSAYVAETVQVCRRRHVVIFADRDEPKKRPDGTVFYPGKIGAEALAKALHRQALTIKIVYPLKGKDARAWLRAGATADVVRCVVTNACEWSSNGR